MDPTRFDRLGKRMIVATGRRDAVRSLGASGLALLASLGFADISAKEPNTGGGHGGKHGVHHQSQKRKRHDHGKQPNRVIEPAAAQDGMLAVDGVDRVQADGRGKNKRRKRKKSPKPGSAGPSPTVRLDAVCAGPVDEGFGFGGNTRRGQTFTALRSGLLVMAQLVMRQSAEPDLDYDLRLSPVDGAGVPTNEILAQSGVANSTVPVGISLVTFSFSRPFAVVAGTEYALILTRPGGGNVNWQFHVGDTCPGQMFVSANQTEPFGALDNHEFVFTTFVSS